MKIDIDLIDARNGTIIKVMLDAHVSAEPLLFVHEGTPDELYGSKLLHFRKMAEQEFAQKIEDGGDAPRGKSIGDFIQELAS